MKTTKWQELKTLAYTSAPARLAEVRRRVRATAGKVREPADKKHKQT